MENFDAAEITRLIRRRRSVYPVQYTGAKIAKEVILTGASVSLVPSNCLNCDLSEQTGMSS